MPKEVHVNNQQKDVYKTEKVAIDSKSLNQNDKTFY
jgi:hypothetical protein